jgi:hypothetical protein
MTALKSGFRKSHFAHLTTYTNRISEALGIYIISSANFVLSNSSDEFDYNVAHASKKKKRHGSNSPDAKTRKKKKSKKKVGC